MGSSSILSPTKTSTRKSITLSATADPPVMSIKPQTSATADKASLNIFNNAEENEPFFAPPTTEEERTTRDSSPSTSSCNTTASTTASTVLGDDDYTLPTRHSTPTSLDDDGEVDAFDVLGNEEAAELAAALERIYLREERERREKERGSLAFYQSLQVCGEVEERWEMHEEIRILGKVGLQAREARTFDGGRRMGRRVWRRRNVVVGMEEWDGD